MLRTVLTVTAAAAATCVLAACGPVQLGAAAIIGSQRISAAQLTNQVTELQATLRAAHGRVQIQFPPSQAPQEVLSWLLRFGVRERMAERNHLTVTPEESQRALAAIAAQVRAGGGGEPLYLLAAANGLPPGMLPELGRYQAIQDALIARLDGGTLPASPAAQQALGQRVSHEQCLAAKSLDIRVNPQFGRLDYSQISVIPAAATLSAPEVPTPSPTPRPQLTPAC